MIGVVAQELEKVSPGLIDETPPDEWTMEHCGFGKKVGGKWEDVLEGFIRDGRVGHSHLNVPGHDGKFGFGGSCFPKDIQAIINYADSLGLTMDTLKGVWKTNLKVRPEKDWEKLEGRAITKDKK